MLTFTLSQIVHLKNQNEQLVGEDISLGAYRRFVKAIAQQHYCSEGRWKNKRTKRYAKHSKEDVSILSQGRKRRKRIQDRTVHTIIHNVEERSEAAALKGVSEELL